MSGRILNALWGAWRLANFDRTGFARFEITAAGFWHSFIAVAVGMPLFALHSFLEHRAAEQMLTAMGKQPVFHAYYLNAGVDYLLMWPAFALVMVLLTRIAGRAPHFAGLVIAYNWSRVIAMAIRLPVMVMLVWGGLGATAFTTIAALTYILIFAYQWYLAKVALDSALAGAAVVLTDIVLGIGLDWGVALVLGNPITILGQ